MSNKKVKLFDSTGASISPETEISQVVGLSELLDTKQDNLTAGNNITIVDNIISATSDVTKAYVDNAVNDAANMAQTYIDGKIDDVKEDVSAAHDAANDAASIAAAAYNAANASVKIADVVNDVTHTDVNKPLSANMGKELQDQISNLKAIGRYLSGWDCTTGLPTTNPTENPYTYKTGDYYIVTKVGDTNYKPNGTSYNQTASTTVETDEVKVGDYYRFDGTVWKIEINTQRTVSFENIAGQPTENSNLAAALNAKQDLLVSGENIKTINNQSILGSGNIEIQAGSGSGLITVVDNELMTYVSGSSNFVLHNIDPALFPSDFFEPTSIGKYNVIVMVCGQSNAELLGGTPVQYTANHFCFAISAETIIGFCKDFVAMAGDTGIAHETEISKSGDDDFLRIIYTGTFNSESQSITVLSETDAHVSVYLQQLRSN